MGFKRPFDDEIFQELPYKHSRQLVLNNKLTRFSEFGPCDTAPEKHDTSGEDGGGVNKQLWHEASENGTVTNELTNLFEKDFETSAPLSLVTSSSSEEDVGSGPTAYAPLSIDHFEYDFPRRTFLPFEDFYSSLLDRSPRKQVPLGQNHQASLSSWDMNMQKNILDGKASLNCNNSSGYLGSDNVVDNDKEEKWLGTCVIPMPDSNSFAHNNDNVGHGAIVCDCLDEGSFRLCNSMSWKHGQSYGNLLAMKNLLSWGYVTWERRCLLNGVKKRNKFFMNLFTPILYLWVEISGSTCHQWSLLETKRKLSAIILMFISFVGWLF